MVDIYGNKVEVGDIIAIPNNSSLEIVKVLRFSNINSYYKHWYKCKLSCRMNIHDVKYLKRGIWTKKDISTQVNSVYDHNSYYYRSIKDQGFVILRKNDTMIDIKSLKNRKRIIQDYEKSQIQTTS